MRHDHFDSSSRPFAASAGGIAREDGLRHARPFARPSGVNWLQIALRMGEIDGALPSGMEAMGPFERPARRRP